MEKQYIIVHPRQRYLEVPYEQQMFGVFSDIDVERKYFKCPRLVGSKQVDITTCHVFVNYISMAGKPGQYECRDVTVVDDYVTFTWELSSNLFDKNEHGNIYFAIQAKRIDADGNLVNVFNTQSARGKACETIEPGKYIEEKHADIILQMMADMETISAKAEDMEKVFEDAMKMLPKKISDLENDVNYATESFVEQEIATFDFIKIVPALPRLGLPNRHYLVPKEDGADNDFYDEYLWIQEKNDYEIIGTRKVEVDLTNYVKNTDYVKGMTAGIVRVGGDQGIGTNASHQLVINPATKIDIDVRSNKRAITSSELDYAVKKGLSDNKLADTDNEWTEEEKQSARDLLNAVGKEDYATKDEAGIVKPYYAYGTDVDSNGLLRLIPTTDAHIINKSDAYRPLTTKQIDLFTKIGLTTNTEVLTPEEQQSAKNWLGVNDIKTVEADKNGEYKYHILDMEDGIYYLPQVTFIQYSSTGNEIKINENSYLFVTSNSESKFFHVFTNFCSIIFGRERLDGTGVYMTKTLNTLADWSVKNTFKAEQTFQVAPKMTTELPVDDNSTNIPNTQWVNSLLDNGRGIKTIKKNEDGTYITPIISDLDEGIYFIPDGVNIQYRGNNPVAILVPNGNTLLIVRRTNKNAREWITFYNEGIWRGSATSTSGTAEYYAFKNLSLITRGEIFSGIKTFAAQPLITAEQTDYTESSTKIPTMAWVQGVLSDKIDTLEAIIDESGVLG